MCTSATDSKHRKFLRHAAADLLIAAFFVLFGAVYEHYSFGVYSMHMIYAFVPLMVTGILFLLIGLREKVPEGSFIFPLELSAITLSVGSASKGAIEIYGTDSRLLKWYYIAAGVMFAAAAVTIIYEIAHSRNN